MSLGCSKSRSKREGYKNIGLLEETRKLSNKQSDCIPKETKIKKNTPNPKLTEGRNIQNGSVINNK